MKHKVSDSEDLDMLDEYDFSGGVRSKYLSRFPKGSSVVILDSDVAGVFSDSEVVNRSLRAFVEMIQHVRTVNVPEGGRVIATEIKVAVWLRDRGRCVVCGATEELHFDHQVPLSKSGTSNTAANVQLLCDRHNLSRIPPTQA